VIPAGGNVVEPTVRARLSRSAYRRLRRRSACRSALLILNAPMVVIASLVRSAIVRRSHVSVSVRHSSGFALTFRGHRSASCCGISGSHKLTQATIFFSTFAAEVGNVVRGHGEVIDPIIVVRQCGAITGGENPL
jgi:hypothetical protein